MDVVITHEHGEVPVSVFHIDGDIDSSNHENLERISFEEIDLGARYVLYDLSQVPFMSSAGFRSLLKIAKKLNSFSETAGKDEAKGMEGGDKKSPFLKLFQPNKLVFSTMELAGLDSLLDVYQEMAAAIFSYHEPKAS
jgi:anti-anti-sigma factor